LVLAEDIGVKCSSQIYFAIAISNAEAFGLACRIEIPVTESRGATLVVGERHTVEVFFVGFLIYPRIAYLIVAD
jgi:hypothetical protein